MNPLLPPGLIFPFHNCVSQNSTIFTLLWAAWVSQSLQGRGVSWAKGEAGRVAGNLFFFILHSHSFAHSSKKCLLHTYYVPGFRCGGYGDERGHVLGSWYSDEGSQTQRAGSNEYCEGK